MLRAKIRGGLRRRAEWFGRRDAARRLTGKEFSIVSDDCWGGELYQLADRPFLTPFIGLFVAPHCYLRILDDLEITLRSTLVEVGISRYPELEQARRYEKYPLGLLPDVDAEVHFLHYTSFRDARDKWLRRRERIRADKLFVKFGPPHDDSAASLVGVFAKLPYEHKLVVDDRAFPSVRTTL